MNIDYDLELKEMLEDLERPRKYLPGTIIYFLVVNTCDLSNEKIYFDAYIDNPEGDDGFKYILNNSYIFGVDKLLEFPDLPKEYIPRLQNMNKLIFVLGKLRDKCFVKKTDLMLRKQANNCIDMMYRESFGMLLDEIKRCGYTEKLKSLEGEALTEYMKFILNFEETKFTKEIIPYFKGLVKENLGD